MLQATSAMNKNSEQWERRFGPPVLVASIATIPLLIVSRRHLAQPWSAVVGLADAASWAVFAAELVVMLVVVRDRPRWLRGHPLEVAVVVLTAPFLNAAIQSLRLLRVLRVLRLTQLAPAMRTILSLQGIQYAALIALLTLIGGAEAFSAAQNVSIGDSLYWAISTMTAVGYGDVAPTTAIAKAVACVVMIVGTGFGALITGAIARHFVSPESERPRDRMTALERSEVDPLDELLAISQRARALEQAPRAARGRTKRQIREGSLHRRFRRRTSALRRDAATRDPNPGRLLHPVPEALDSVMEHIDTAAFGHTQPCEHHRRAYPREQARQGWLVGEARARVSPPAGPPLALYNGRHPRRC
jgi:voltage-gated potassium channel